VARFPSPDISPSLAENRHGVRTENRHGVTSDFAVVSRQKTGMVFRRKIGSGQAKVFGSKVANSPVTR
jgi:hypothetical protein